MDESEVFAHEEDLFRERCEIGAGAGHLLPDERDRGLDDFSVAFGGGGVRSGAFCSGALWALAEVGRLRHVTHISSVSGGSIAASGFASFLVAREAEASAAGNVDAWYREVVADFIQRCQKNAGYLVSFSDDPWKVPSDNSSSLPRVLDLVLMAMVIMGVLVAAPTVFCVFYVVPLSLLIEAYWGAVMREYFCKKDVRGEYRDVFSLVLEGQVLLKTILLCTLVLVILALAYKVLHLERRRDEKVYLFWRSLVHLCGRWVLLLSLVLITVVLVFIAEQWDYGGLRLEENVCDNYRNNLCSGGSLETSAAHQEWFARLNTSNLLQAETMQIPGMLRSGQDAAFLPPSTNPSGRPAFFWMMLVSTVVIAILALSLLALGWDMLWHAFLVILLPLWFIWPASFVLQWRTFGPVTGQPLLTPFVDTKLVGAYSDQAWDLFAGWSLVFAMLGLPIFNLLHRFVHYYFGKSMQKAFYHGGKDVAVEKVAACRWAPVLLFGATLNEFQRPQDDEPHTSFTLSQHVMGCERTKFLKSPSWLTLAKCMTLSCAAIDGFVLTQVNKWHTRVLMAMLNITQGDALRFDVGQNWHSLADRFEVLKRNPHMASFVDRVPEMLLWFCIYFLLYLANKNSVKEPGDDSDTCVTFRALRDAVLVFIAAFVGVFSFFSHVRYLCWLTASPLIRQMQMFLMFHESSDQPPMYLYLTDGGPVEDLGIVQLLRRRRRWILSLDVGDDPSVELIDLRAAIALARQERICSFYDAADPRRDLDVVLERYSSGREPFLHLGVLYSQEGSSSSDRQNQVGEIFHVRMRLLEQGPGLPVQPLVSREEVLVQRELSATSQRAQRVHFASEMELSQPAPGSLLQRADEPLSQRSEGAALEASQPLDVPRGQLAGICCECCHQWSHGAVCGPFPNTNTVNQFFTPVMWANFCRLGKELAGPTIAALTAAQIAEASARRRLRTASARSGDA